MRRAHRQDGLIYKKTAWFFTGRSFSTLQSSGQSIDFLGEVIRLARL
jgi:hypothetical protein